MALVFSAELPYALFVTERVPSILLNLVKFDGFARAAGDVESGRLARLIGDDLLRDLGTIARDYALISELAIIEVIHATQAANRPPQHEMETHIVSRPDAFGSVRVAEVSELNKIVNPRGFGPFWRAQEYGTGSDGVPSQEGRPIFGTYEPSETPPDAEQQGRGQGRDLAFIPGGSNPGEGVIQEELPARHFLLHGTEAAGLKWREAIVSLESSYLRRIEALLDGLRKRRTGVITVRHTIDG